MLNVSAPQTSNKSYFARLVTTICTKIVNVPVLTDNPYVGIDGAMASLALGSVDNNRRLQGDPTYGDPAIAEILSDPYLRRKVVVHILDALVAQYAGGPRFNPQFTRLARRDLRQPRSGRHRRDRAAAVGKVSHRGPLGPDRRDRQDGRPCPQRHIVQPRHRRPVAHPVGEDRAMNAEPSAGALAMDRLLAIMTRLRAPGGCAWDREQTPATLKPQLLEECYEVLEAIDSGSPAALSEELGDLLLHVVFQAEIAREQGEFAFADVANGIVDKLIRRHPHVFGANKTDDPAQIVAQWNDIKKAEKPERTSALDGVPRALPALMRAEAVQKKAKQVGFDWPDANGSLAKVREEIAEVTAEMEADLALAAANGIPFAPAEKTAEELGDLLFSIVNLTRHLKLDAEGLLTDATDKFTRRFQARRVADRSSGEDHDDLHAGGA